jgi:hypothetical protein
MARMLRECSTANRLPQSLDRRDDGEHPPVDLFRPSLPVGQPIQDMHISLYVAVQHLVLAPVTNGA